jgi:hypothetical protein
MNLLPSGVRIFLLAGLMVASGMICLITAADYSIGTIIEATGPVRNSFTGTFSQADGNGTNVSGVYSDSVMTNGGSLSLTKQVGMSEKSSGQGFETQKVVGYSSGTSGGHLIADEYVLTSSDMYSNKTQGAICFGDPYLVSSCISGEQSASFSIANAKTLTLASAGRSSNGTLDYSLSIGTPQSNASNPGLEGTVISAIHGKTKTQSGEVSLYDRTLISGLITTFTRLYHGGEQQELSEMTSTTGSVHDKTILEQKYSQNDTTSGKISSGTAVYAQDVMTNGGKTHETRQISGSGSISSERLVEYTSDGDRSIQASEHVVATRMSEGQEDSGTPACALGGTISSGEEKSPYKQASAQTGIAGVSSARISSTTRISDPERSDELNLEYNANVMIPIGFNASMVQEMKDTDNDGRFEDLNGNGRLDMHDLVLLFQNFRWIGESNLSLRIDFNKNGRADYADIVTIFNSMNQTSSK